MEGSGLDRCSRSLSTATPRSVLQTLAILRLCVLAAVLGCSTPPAASSTGAYSLAFDVAPLAANADAAGAAAAAADAPSPRDTDAAGPSDADSWAAADASDAPDTAKPDAALEVAAPADAADGAADLPVLSSDAGGAVWQPAADCAPATQKIYLLTKNYQLLAYLPQSQQITVIGTLECPAEYATWPFSMAVDRKGTAWVMYSSGELFQVSTANAACQPTPWPIGEKGFIESGMGFAADGPGSSAETLYVGSAKGKLGAIDLGTFTATVLGNIAIVPGWPELTGTGQGELWGFFPQSQPARIARIHKATGAVDQVKLLAELQMAAVKNWAFAHWGGRFLMFFQGEKDPSTSVYVYDPIADTYGLFQPTLGYPVVGAGVSSCAPTSWVMQP